MAKDDAEAVKWFRKVADQGYAKAQYSLGNMYALGQGVTKDDAEAVNWLRKAAEQGYVDAQYLLGTMYLIGRGVPKDGTEAVKWLILTCNRNGINNPISASYALKLSSFSGQFWHAFF